MIVENERIKNENNKLKNDIKHLSEEVDNAKTIISDLTTKIRNTQNTIQIKNNQTKYLMRIIEEITPTIYITVAKKYNIKNILELMKMIGQIIYKTLNIQNK